MIRPSPGAFCAQVSQALPSWRDRGAHILRCWVSGRQFGGIVVPEAECVGSGMTPGRCGRAVATGAEDDIDLVMG